MFEEREVLTLLIAAAVLAFGVRHRATLRALPNSTSLILSYGLLVFSYLCSVAEAIVWHDQMNLVQHVAAGLSALVLFRWSWITLGPRRIDQVGHDSTPFEDGSEGTR